MTTKSYTVLGWVVWQVGSRVAKKKMAENRVKLGAVGVVALVLVGGVVAARSAGGDDDG
jgi:isoaspartyl peptidase/L-asparaginase-like protein (Ntn-hydrolase superfamily)